MKKPKWTIWPTQYCAQLYIWLYENKFKHLEAFWWSDSRLLIAWSIRWSSVSLEKRPGSKVRGVRESSGIRLVAMYWVVSKCFSNFKQPLQLQPHASKVTISFVCIYMQTSYLLFLFFMRVSVLCWSMLQIYNTLIILRIIKLPPKFKQIRQIK